MGKAVSKELVRWLMGEAQGLGLVSRLAPGLRALSIPTVSSDGPALEEESESYSKVQ